MHENEIGRIVVDATVMLHQDIGPGLLESVYSLVLADLLSQRGLNVDREVPIPFVVAGHEFAQGFRADMIVEHRVIIELKSVERLHLRSQNRTLLAAARRQLDLWTGGRDCGDDRAGSLPVAGRSG